MYYVVVCAQGGYHGRTIGAMSLTTSKTIYSAGFGPLMSGVTVVPFPYALHGPIQDEGKEIASMLQRPKRFEC